MQFYLRTVELPISVVENAMNFSIFANELLPRFLADLLVLEIKYRPLPFLP